MAKKKTEIAFPRTLYKPAERSDPTAMKWGSDQRGGAFHSLLVNDEKERKAGLQMGYFDDFAKGRSLDFKGEETNDAESNDTAETDSEEPDETDSESEAGETERDSETDQDETERDSETDPEERLVTEDEGF